jgi:hypothetical protein
MSLVSAKLKQREADTNTAQRSERWTYVVVMDSASDTATAAMAAVGIPLFTPHPDDPGMVAQQFGAKFIQDSTYAFEVVVTFASQTTTQTASDPLEQPAQVDISGSEVKIPLVRDMITGLPVLNSAGDSFDQPISTTIYDELIRITVNLDEIDTETYNQYRGAVNADEFVITLPDGSERTIFEGCAKMGNILATYKFQNGRNYWQVVFPIYNRYATAVDIANRVDGKIRPWKRNILDEGYNEIAETMKVPIYLDDGKRPASPQLLDENGARITTDPAVPHYLFISDYVELPFGSLNLTEATS